MELSLIFISGLLGSAHCVGMCGPFAVLISSPARSGFASLARQLVYTLGRVFIYAVLGAMAAFAGLRIERSLPLLRYSSAVLAILAGLILVWEGLRGAGLWPTRWQVRAAAPCLVRDLFAGFLKGPGWSNVFFAGMMTGLLPCGFLYAFVALAASTRHLGHGALLMAVFAAGTAPAMILTGTTGAMLSGAARMRFFRLAAYCVIVAGGLTLSRGVTLVAAATSDEPAATCPFCKSESSAKPRDR